MPKGHVFLRYATESFTFDPSDAKFAQNFNISSVIPPTRVRK
jgi:hypothetical protein